MNLEVLKTFYTVAKCGNISKAAKILYTSQPAVSRTISNLESSVSTKLFIRNKFGVMLTREGLNLYQRIENTFNELEKLDEDISKNKGFNQYTIYIGATVTSLHCYLFKYLDILKNLYPDVNFRIYTGGSNHLLDLLKSGKIDIACITTPFNKSDELYTQNILKIENILIAPIEYKNKLSGEVSIKDLENYPFILLEKDMQFREHIDKFFSQNDVNISPQYEADSSSVLIPFVERNYGLTFVPEEMAIEDLKEGKIIKVNLKEKMPIRYVSLAYNTNLNYSHIIYNIIKTIQQHSEL